VKKEILASLMSSRPFRKDVRRQDVAYQNTQLVQNAGVLLH